MRHRILLPCVILNCLLAALVSYAVAASPSEKPAAADTTDQKVGSHPGLQRRNPRYELCRGDVLGLSFPLTPEYDQTITVQPDGYITLLRVGDLRVVGQTIPEVTKSIHAAYATTLHNPIITLQLKDFEKPYFIVGGEVGHPGKYDLRGDTTVIQAVSIAGGFTEGSKHSQVWLFRRVSDDWVETERIDVKKMLRAGNLAEDAELHPGDMIYVPKNQLEKMKRFLPTSAMSLYLGPFL